MRILTFDVEEWFNIPGYAPSRDVSRWDSFEKRIYDNTDKVLRLLDKSEANATFFVGEWVARNYPSLVRRISSKYQIGVQTAPGKPVWESSPEEFRDELHSAISMIEDVCGRKVDVFKAPCMSVRDEDAWVFEILGQEGIEFDCSAYPERHPHGGMPDLRNTSPAGPCIIEHNGIRMKEFPASVRLLKKGCRNYCSGAGFRTTPLFLEKKWMKKEDYVISHFSIRDFDTHQPVLKGMPLKKMAENYLNLGIADFKLRSCLNSIKFTDIADAAEHTDWNNVPVYTI